MRWPGTHAAAAVLLLSAAAGNAAAQAPGWPLSLGSCSLLHARPGEVKTLYWELYKHTEVCVDLVPEPGPSAPSPLAITFSFTHTGQKLEGAPATVLFRAQMPPYAALRTASLQVTLDEGAPQDLTAVGQPYQVTYPPGCAGLDTGCGFTGVEVALPRETFLRWANAKTIRGVAFGVAFALPPGTHEALLKMAAAMRPPS